MKKKLSVPLTWVLVCIGRQWTDDFFIFILLSQESNECAMHRTNPFAATFLLILIMIVFANLASSLSNIADSSSTSYLCSKSAITFVICNFPTILSIVTASIICVNMNSLCKPFIMRNRIGLDTSSSTALSLHGIVSQMIWYLLQVFLC